jgi:hypothetical protein
MLSPSDAHELASVTDVFAVGFSTSAPTHAEVPAFQ